MEFGTEMLEKIAELLAEELKQVAEAEEAIVVVEDRMRAALRQVGQRALGKYLSEQETVPAPTVVCRCGEEAS